MREQRQRRSPVVVTLVIGLLLLVAWFVLVTTVDLGVGVGSAMIGAAAGVLAATVSVALLRRRD
ncbi:hypothetical protein [Plantactinospora sonchi]|uniref:Uncharacterized protein n=1 Tax=Plantactinospora sonchi TaxID=1544735 RepID=A0ABU7RQ95_9ACTN